MKSWIAILSCTALCLAGCTREWSADERAEIMSEGGAVVAAIDSYIAERSAAPETLDSLVPDYLEAIAAPDMDGFHWEYIVTGKQDFVLAATHPARKGELVYDSYAQRWLWENSP